ncbi:DgyrCDS2936 [Dimorphilus gyrociliatus]|uniref:histone deacetylase n=1 Tax=Dimorphilus gyrociliatus TaxID=2664684 RepID=A0A7I8VCA0_9ANNE|nr:DgyrCDS2936 [Dimorphilus gyrociliatus]
MFGSVGYCYTELVNKHVNKRVSYHLESPIRVTHCKSYLEERGILQKCIYIPYSPISEALLLKVHDQSYLDILKSFTDDQKSFVFENESTVDYRYTYVCKDTYDASLTAASCLVTLSDQVLAGKVKHGIALCRPPNHHAEKNLATGFCFLNGIAMMAENALAKGRQRILILDWDIHHGNGIQKHFYRRNDVLYISFHRYDHGEYYPGLKIGNFDAIGEGRGKHFNINIAWNDEKMTNGDYKYGFDQIVEPVMNQYQPDLVIIASGFDAMENDPLGEYHLTPSIYSYMINKIKDIGKTNILISLEGGYSKDNIAAGMAACIESLQDNVLPDTNWNEPNAKCLQTINQVKRAHNEYWNF